MRKNWTFGLALLPLALSACGDTGGTTSNAPAIEVRSELQNKLHTLDALNLAITLKRAIQDLGYTCQRIDDAGFVGKYKNSDMWTVKCNDGRNWAVFAGADGSAQVRDCKDLAGSDVPACTITKRPEGNIRGDQSSGATFTG